jgi:hypothetical protein
MNVILKLHNIANATNLNLTVKEINVLATLHNLLFQ